MKVPHKHAALIHAWADGAEIQIRNTAGVWQDIPHSAPSWAPDNEYRIKPEPKILPWKYVPQNQLDRLVLEILDGRIISVGLKVEKIDE